MTNLAELKVDVAQIVQPEAVDGRRGHVEVIVLRRELPVRIGTVTVTTTVRIGRVTQLLASGQ